MSPPTYDRHVVSYINNAINSSNTPYKQPFSTEWPCSYVNTPYTHPFLLYGDVHISTLHTSIPFYCMAIICQHPIHASFSTVWPCSCQYTHPFSTVWRCSYITTPYTHPFLLYRCLCQYTHPFLLYGRVHMSTPHTHIPFLLYGPLGSVLLTIFLRYDL